AAHEAAVRGMPATVAKLAGSPAVDRFTVLNRDGAVLEDSSRPGPDRHRGPGSPPRLRADRLGCRGACAVGGRLIGGSSGGRTGGRTGCRWWTAPSRVRRSSIA
ncbi:MAG: hypothetical protein ACRC35_14665, partial [Angustibacter sp.]